jgi:hypothetical protein
MPTLEARIWKHTFLHGPDEERLRTLRKHAERAEETLNDKPPRSASAKVASAAHRAAAAAADDFAAEAESRGISIILRTLGRKKYAELTKDHPPRDGDAKDANAGVNIDTFYEALVRSCWASPALSDDELGELLDSLTPAQFELIALAAFSLHRNLGADPKERLLSEHTPS